MRSSAVSMHMMLMRVRMVVQSRRSANGMSPIAARANVLQSLEALLVAQRLIDLEVKVPGIIFCALVSMCQVCAVHARWATRRL